jgi:hypothetical protein
MISTMAEFIEKISAYHKRYSKENGVEYELFYRGIHKNYGDPNIPSMYYPPSYHIEKEHIIFKEIISRFPDVLENQRTTIEKLIWMQHYVFPTRLLDITKNPLVGLFFSCFDERKVGSIKDDGLVCVYRVPKNEIRFCDSDLTAIVANLCKRKFSFTQAFEYSENSDEFKNDLNIDLLCYEIGKDNAGFEKYIKKEDIRSVVCVCPHQNNPRIIRQSGHFFLFGIKDSEKNEPAKLKSDWVLEPIKISHTSKTNFLRDLEILNVNEAFVYPEYEHFSNVIKEKYKKGAGR